MYTTKMTAEEALACFGAGVDCSQAVFGEFAPQFGIDEDQAYRIGACFGGGMFEGETCGAVTGALMVLGLKYGQGYGADPQRKEEMIARIMEFKEEFADEYGSCICSEILGYKIPEDMDAIMEENKFGTVCCNAVVDACRIVCGMLNSR